MVNLLSEANLKQIILTLKKHEQILEDYGKRIRYLENHALHRHDINQILDWLRKVGAATTSELRRKFPFLVGTPLSRLYRAIDELEDFIRLSGVGRGVQTVLAYLPKNSKLTPRQIAVHYFLSIKPAKQERMVTERGRLTWKWKGKDGTLEEIMNKYQANPETAKEIMNQIIHLFNRRIILAPNKTMFKRKY